VDPFKSYTTKCCKSYYVVIDSKKVCATCLAEIEDELVMHVKNFIQYEADKAAQLKTAR